MKYKELMIKSLSDLLDEGEVLLHPIYCSVEESGVQHYAFLGLTQNHLLSVIISGKSILSAQKIPLSDIKSIKIKKTLILKQYKINISFEDSSPTKILASQKVLTIPSQKESLPLFLEFLQSRAPKQEKEELKNIAGSKIRWQYFNTFICTVSAALVMVPTMLSVSDIKNGNFTAKSCTENILTSLIMWAVIILPFALLSLLNKFFFGKVLCVANEEGLHLENNLIFWQDIQRIEYSPRLISRYSAERTYATLWVKPSGKNEYPIQIAHFPRYGIKKIKKYNPQIKTTIDKKGRSSILVLVLVPIILSVLIPLFS